MPRARPDRAAGRAVAALLTLCFLAGPSAACRQALVLALDVSGSVDASEYVLQVQGVASALNDPEVRAALLMFPEAPVALSAFEWSGGSYQRDILPWTLLKGDADIDAAIAVFMAWQRAPAPQATGIGAALLHAEERLAAAPPCWRQTVDISGDGKNNDWPDPRRVYADGNLPGVTVNALIVAEDMMRGDDHRRSGVQELMAYFQNNVIQGPDAFIEVALGYDDYANAMARKFLKELSSVALGGVPDSGEPPVASGLRVADAGAPFQ